MAPMIVGAVDHKYVALRLQAMYLVKGNYVIDTAKYLPTEDPNVSLVSFSPLAFLFVIFINSLSPLAYIVDV